jgi:hypothetical protein
MSRLALVLTPVLCFLKKKVTNSRMSSGARHGSHQEETVSSVQYGVELRIYWIGSRLQLRKGGPLISQLGGGQTTYHHDDTK